MKRILVNLPDDRLAVADAKAKELGISRSELARRAIDHFISHPIAGVETREDRIQRVRRLLDRMQASGREMKRLNPEWDPVALIRASRQGRIRL